MIWEREKIPDNDPRSLYTGTVYHHTNTPEGRVSIKQKKLPKIGWCYLVELGEVVYAAVPTLKDAKAAVELGEIFDRKPSPFQGVVKELSSLSSLKDCLTFLERFGEFQESVTYPEFIRINELFEGKLGQVR